MTEQFDFNARQYFNFNNAEDDLLNESYFDVDEDIIPSIKNVNMKLYEGNSESAQECEAEEFYSPYPMVYVNEPRPSLRRTSSLQNIRTQYVLGETKECNDLNERSLDDLAITNGHTLKTNNASYKEHINRLAQPKRFPPHHHLASYSEMTLAEAVNKFHAGTPRRFRSKANLSNAGIPVNKKTHPQAPKLMTSNRSRPVLVLSKEEQEIREAEEVRKFKIKAKPVNKRILKGPMKAQLEKKPATVSVPFHLTEMAKKQEPTPEEKIANFKAKPMPKCLSKPFTVEHISKTTIAQSPNFSSRLKRFTQTKGKDESSDVKPKPAPVTMKKEIPFSFEERQERMLKKRQAFINKVWEEEKKAREFHARPVPKAILRSRNNSPERPNGQAASNLKRSTEEIENFTFRAKPATVLKKKPFEPRHDETHDIEVEEFQFSTDQRKECRREFEQKLREKEAQNEALKQQREESLKRAEEREVARLRKQMEHKAQPIKKYKELVIERSNKCTSPISPKFHTDLRKFNKENIQQKQ